MSADFCKISKINDRRKKPYDFLNNISLICFSMNMEFPLLQKISKVVYISQLPKSTILYNELQNVGLFA